MDGRASTVGSASASGLVVPGNFDPTHKRQQYGCDITYGTNNEFGFDYLRDNMAMSRAEQVQRGHIYCIVDEVDSILIDEARTPLIISGRVADAAKLYYQFAVHRPGPQARRRTTTSTRRSAPSPPPTRASRRSSGPSASRTCTTSVSQNLVHQLQAALRAKELFKRDKDYVVQNGEVKIVDEFTGRILEGRRWSEGLHQAVEAKEGVKIKEENQTLATITLQNYFRMYDKLAGMTGTAETEAAEFASTYDLPVVPIPTNKPLDPPRPGRPHLQDRGRQVRRGRRRHRRSATRRASRCSWAPSRSPSPRSSPGSSPSGAIPHEVLNAKQHFREADIVAQAGRLGAVTVATNMAGRGVDILLGGNPEGLAERDVRGRGHRPRVRGGSGPRTPS